MVRVAGCDLGKATAKLAVATVGPDGAIAEIRATSIAHEGEALQVFRDWYERERIATCAALGATGVHADELVAPVVSGLSEDACLERVLTGPLNLIDVGARGYAVLTRDVQGRVQSLENSKCSSGTGETSTPMARRSTIDR